MKMAKFAALVFDLDGTLSDSVPMILRSSLATHEKMGLPWDEEQAKSFIGRPMYETAAEFAPGREQEYMDNFREYNFLYIPKMIRPFAGIPTLIAKLQEAEVPMCIVTSRLQWGADWSAEILGIQSYFTKIFGVEASQKHKPDPEPALLALAEMGITPEQAKNTAFIGDAPVDIACGRAAGMQTIGVGWGVGGKDSLLAAGADYYVEDVNALARLLLL